MCLASRNRSSLPPAVRYTIPLVTNPIIPITPKTDNKKFKIFVNILPTGVALVITPLDVDGVLGVADVSGGVVGDVIGGVVGEVIGGVGGTGGAGGAGGAGGVGGATL